MWGFLFSCFIRDPGLPKILYRFPELLFGFFLRIASYCYRYFRFYIVELCTDAKSDLRKIIWKASCQLLIFFKKSLKVLGAPLRVEPRKMMPAGILVIGKPSLSFLSTLAALFYGLPLSRGNSKSPLKGLLQILFLMFYFFMTGLLEFSFSIIG
jgi:hypothetical protein